MQFSDKIAPLKPSAIREIFKVLGDPSIISLAGGNPAPETFPVKEFQTLSAKLFEENGKNALQYGLTEGYLPLRKKITERLKEKLGIGRDFDETIVVTGGQQGVDLTCKILCNEGDVLLCEDPSFIGALNAFRSYNTRLVGIPVDDCGMQIDKLEQALKKEKKAKLIYTIPTFQNPTGVCMSLERRKALYALAKKYGVIIIEDNPYGELRFHGEEIPTIKSMDEDGIVVYCGSFSKILSPGMRIGFLCAQKEIVSKIIVAKQVNDVHTNLFFQMLTDAYMETYDLDGHIREIRELYRKKCAAMQAAAKQYLPANVSVTSPEGGIFLWCRMPETVDSQKFANRLLRRNVAVVPGMAFSPDDAPSNGMRLNYSMPTEEQIDRAIQQIGEELREILF